MNNLSPSDKLNALWQGAAYQDHLLQSYRGYFFTLQSALLIIGVGLTTTSLVLDGFTNMIIVCTLLIAISILALYVLHYMQKLIKARSADVDYYHQQIIAFEQTLSQEDRVLTAFKVYQKYNKQPRNENTNAVEVTADIISTLTEKDRGHTRQLLDNKLFIALQMLWYLLLTLAFIKIILLFA